MKPIPDEVLRVLAGHEDQGFGQDMEHLLRGSERALARELLAARLELRSCAAELEDAASLCIGMANRESEYSWDDWMGWSEEYAIGAKCARRLLPDPMEAP